MTLGNSILLWIFSGRPSCWLNWNRHSSNVSTGGRRVNHNWNKKSTTYHLLVYTNFTPGNWKDSKPMSHRSAQNCAPSYSSNSFNCTGISTTHTRMHARTHPCTHTHTHTLLWIIISFAAFYAEELELCVWNQLSCQTQRFRVIPTSHPESAWQCFASTTVHSAQQRLCGQHQSVIIKQSSNTEPVLLPPGLTFERQHSCWQLPSVPGQIPKTDLTNPASICPRSNTQDRPNQSSLNLS